MESSRAKDKVTYADICRLETGVSVRQVLALCLLAMWLHGGAPFFVTGGSEPFVTSLLLAPSAGVPSNDSSRRICFG